MARTPIPLDSPLNAWHDALTSLQLLQLDPHGFGGVRLRAPHGPVRDSWLSALARLGLPLVKVPGSADAERLLGGIDLAHTLQTGQLRMQSGLLQQADQGLVCLPMAERMPPALLAPLVQALDSGQVLPLHHHSPASSSRFGVVALDESTPDEPGLGVALQERLGIWLDLQTLSPSDIALELTDVVPLASEREADDLQLQLSPQALQLARERLQQIQASDAQLQALCASAMGLGISSLRAPSLALRVACSHAALHGRSMLDEEDLGFAARCVLAPRATQWPAEPSTPPDHREADSTPPPTEQDPATGEPPSEPPSDSNPPSPEPSAEDLEDMMVAAALASLPPHLLDALATQGGSRQSNTSGRSGQTRAGQQRGRPLPPRPGRPGGHARLHVLATLRAAAPRQRLRQTQHTRQGGVLIRAEDFHIQRYQQRASSCLILALDASGSAALQRLAEAKGAVELLLQQSYARRDSVCIVAFRGAQAQLLLPATRSLVRAKRAMTGLPGGGGTPLALALKMAHEQAAQLQRQGVTPILVVLSDGRANVTLKGLGGRAEAQADAQQWGQQWQHTGHRALWIDTSLQPDAQARALAATMGAQYLPMPQVQAQRMASAMGKLRAETA
jgi:magnesium chelatase subunit D